MTTTPSHPPRGTASRPDRRQVLRATAAVAAAAAALGSPSARAQAGWPARPIKIIVPYTPGASGDLVTRTVSEYLGKRLGQAIVIENMPGASTKIGSDFVARARPDGHTLLLNATLAMATLASVSTGRPADTANQFTMVARFARLPQVIVARADFGASTLQETFHLARSQPGRISYGSTGNGSPAHLMFALLEQQAGVRMVHTPYKGGAQALTDLLGGHVDLTLLVVSTVRDLVQSGKLKALAMYAGERSAALPAVPTVGELGLPPAAFEAAYGFMGPAGLPPEIAATLAKELRAVLADPALQAALRDRGLEHEFVGPEDYRAQTHMEAARIAEIVKSMQLKAE